MNKIVVSGVVVNDVLEATLNLRALSAELSRARQLMQEQRQAYIKTGNRVDDLVKRVTAAEEALKAAALAG